MPKKSKQSGHQKQKKSEPEPSPEPVMEDVDMEQMSDDMMMPEESGPLFWSMKVEANKTADIDQPAIPNYIVHITNACFGPTVTKNSRSVVMVTTTNEDGEDEQGFPICVLRQGHQENQSLDLLFNESASLTVQGMKPSDVFLTGYIQPPVSPEDMGPMDPMMEDMDEAQIMEALKEQKRQQQELDDEEPEEPEEPEESVEAEEPESEDEEVEEPPTKKQKTAKGQKATANGTKTDKKRKSAKGNAESEEEVKPVKESKKKKKKGGMQKMSGGIKFKDMQSGKGVEAKKGDKLKVYYVGQTDDKAVFDKSITGSGFEFTLGKGEVIKGWDIGLKGMKVGGKRKLIIPSKMAYGSEGSPPAIPPNAQLTFTIQLKAVNGSS